MAVIHVKCPYCGSEDVIFFGYSKSGKQRCRCRNSDCAHKTFQLEYSQNASRPGIGQQIIDLAMNGSGTRDTARVLKIDKDTVTRHLRKLTDFVENVNTDYLEKMEGKQIDIHIVNPFEDDSTEENPDEAEPEKAQKASIDAEMDEQWSYCGSKKNKYGSGGLLITRKISRWHSALELVNIKTLISFWNIWSPSTFIFISQIIILPTAVESRKKIIK